MAETPTNDELAELLRWFRHTYDMSRRDAGEYLGLSHRTIEGIEQGRGFANGRLLYVTLIWSDPRCPLANPVDKVPLTSVIRSKGGADADR